MTPFEAPRELHAYYSESWFTAAGARLKARRLQQAGIPHMKNWRFVTLTIASRSISPLEAYQLGKERIRRFLARFRKATGYAFRWCWKLEFHEDGYPHWHMPLEYLKRVPEDMLPLIESWWGLGRINIKRIKGRDLRYVFKYVAKGPDELPEWVSRHKGRIRVFQASRGFYTKRKKRETVKREPLSCLVRVDLFTRMGWDERKAFVVAETAEGLKRLRVVKLRTTFSSLLVAAANEAIRKRIPLPAPGAIALSDWSADVLLHEQPRFKGLAFVPSGATRA